jgi:hypothetical protein
MLSPPRCRYSNWRIGAFEESVGLRRGVGLRELVGVISRARRVEFCLPAARAGNRRLKLEAKRPAGLGAGSGCAGSTSHRWVERRSVGCRRNTVGSRCTGNASHCGVRRRSLRTDESILSQSISCLVGDWLEPLEAFPEFIESLFQAATESAPPLLPFYRSCYVSRNSYLPKQRRSSKDNLRVLGSASDKHLLLYTIRVFLTKDAQTLPSDLKTSAKRARFHTRRDVRLELLDVVPSPLRLFAR